MKNINRICTIVIIALIGIFACYRVFIIRIEPGTVGVRTKEYAIFGAKGVAEKDFGPGWHRRIPPIDTWTIFDSTVQTLEFSTREERVRSSRWQSLTKGRLPLRRGKSPPVVMGAERVNLKSVDGYSVELDATVKYRIVPGEAHRLYQDAGTEGRYKEIVRTEAEDTLRSIFGEMSTEEFYNPTVRRQRTDEANTLLAKKLVDRHVEVIAILVRDISFDPTYEQKILDKKLADQDVELNRSKALAEEKRGETNKITAETDAKVLVIDQEQASEKIKMKAETERKIAQIRADARLDMAKTRADADLYAAKKIATGALLEKKAEAEGERLKAQALQGSGGSNLVALEAARELQLKAMTLSTIRTDFLDVEAMADKLGASK